MDEYKKLTDEHLKIIEQASIKIQKNIKKIDENEHDNDNNRIQDLKLFSFSYKLLKLLIKSPFGIVLASSFLGICLITLLELFCNNKSKLIKFGNIKNSKSD